MFVGWLFICWSFVVVQYLIFCGELQVLILVKGIVSYDLHLSHSHD